MFNIGKRTTKVLTACRLLGVVVILISFSGVILGQPEATFKEFRQKVALSNLGKSSIGSLTVDELARKYFEGTIEAELFIRSKGVTSTRPIISKEPEPFIMDLLTNYSIDRVDFVGDYNCSTGRDTFSRLLAQIDIVTNATQNRNTYEIAIDFIETPLGWKIIRIYRRVEMNAVYPCKGSPSPSPSPSPPPLPPPPPPCLDSTLLEEIKLKDDTIYLYVAAQDSFIRTIDTLRDSIIVVEKQLRDTVFVLQATKDTLRLTRDTLDCFREFYEIQDTLRKKSDSIVKDLDLHFASVLSWIGSARTDSGIRKGLSFQDWLRSKMVLDSIMPIYQDYRRLANFPITVECINGQSIEYQLDFLTPQSYINLSYLLFHNLGDIVVNVEGDNLCDQINEFNEIFLTSVGAAHRAVKYDERSSFEKIARILPCIGYRVIQEKSCSGTTKDGNQLNSSIRRVGDFFDDGEYTNAIIEYLNISHIINMEGVSKELVDRANYSVGTILFWDLGNASGLLKGVPPCALEILLYEWNSYNLAQQRKTGELMLKSIIEDGDAKKEYRILANRSLQTKKN